MRASADAQSTTPPRTPTPASRPDALLHAGRNLNLMATTLSAGDFLKRAIPIGRAMADFLYDISGAGYLGAVMFGILVFVAVAIMRFRDKG